MSSRCRKTPYNAYTFKPTFSFKSAKVRMLHICSKTPLSHPCAIVCLNALLLNTYNIVTSHTLGVAFPSFKKKRRNFFFVTYVDDGKKKNKKK